MPGISGLSGLRPARAFASDFCCPPYDVIKPGTALERCCFARKESLVHITLGKDPMGVLKDFTSRSVLIEDAVPCLYVLEQTSMDGFRRLGVFCGVEVAPYATGKVRRHEKTFDDKVQGRLALTRQTGLTLEPIFLLAKEGLGARLEQIVSAEQPCYDFVSDFAKANDLDALRTRAFRVPADCPAGKALIALLAPQDLYIADGHHRYHAALVGGQTHALAYVTDGARIRAYNRVINGKVPFAQIMKNLPLKPAPAFATPGKHAFCIYHQGKAWTLEAQKIPTDVVGGLDCSILERELYPALGLNHSMIMDHAYFDYYPETELPSMVAAVDSKKYDLAVALHPVDIADLMAVADAGLKDSNVVMPEKSTYFAPKIPSGVILYRHSQKPA